MKFHLTNAFSMKLFRRKDKKKKDPAGLLDIPGGGGGFGGSGYNHQGSRYGRYDDEAGNNFPRHGGWMPTSHRPTPRSAAMVAALPDRVLRCIFGFVCPHTKDESYDTCEQSALDDACMLCDLRDLSHCAKVSRRWRANAVRRL
jgi:hypothetical protein